MRCGCPHCGIYMVQKEQGLSSACVCPGCLHKCSACMGGTAAPISRGELQSFNLLTFPERTLSSDEND